MLHPMVPRLAVLLILRTWWGRIWTQAIFLIHLLFVGHMLVVRHPELWIYSDPSFRIRLLITLVMLHMVLGLS